MNILKCLVFVDAFASMHLALHYSAHFLMVRPEDTANASNLAID